MRADQYDVLVACERSGVLRDALIRVGVRAISCDLHESRRPGPHLVRDARQVVRMRHWRAVIAFPDCTFLTNAGSKHLYRRDASGRWSIDNGRDPARWRAMREAVEFFLLFERAAHVPLRCVENPIMHRHAARLIGRRADQFVHPWHFGDPRQKATGLHLTGLPRLVRTRERDSYAPGEIRQECHGMAPSPMRAELRARTSPAVARAMARQWGPLLRGEQP